MPITTKPGLAIRKIASAMTSTIHSNITMSTSSGVYRVWAIVIQDYPTLSYLIFRGKFLPNPGLFITNHDIQSNYRYFMKWSWSSYSIWRHYFSGTTFGPVNNHQLPPTLLVSLLWNFPSSDLHVLYPYRDLHWCPIDIMGRIGDWNNSEQWWYL